MFKKTSLFPRDGFPYLLLQVGEPLYGAGFSRVTVEVEEQTQSRLRVRIHPTGEQRWQVPINIQGSGTAAKNPLYDVQFTYEPVFSFKVSSVFL